MTMDNLSNAVGELSNPLGVPWTMQLSAQETERAQAIKASVEAAANLTNLTDFEYVQYALARSDSPLDSILYHIEMMQVFRDTYNIKDSLQEGLDCVDAMLRQQPGQTLKVHYLPQMRFCVAISDWAAFHPSRCTQTQEQYAIYLKGMYYRLQSLHPCCSAIREGVFEVVECDGVSWENCNEDFTRDCFESLLIHYPKNYKSAFYVNTNTVVNVSISLSKKYMDQNMRDTLQLGHQIAALQGKRINGIFQAPSPEIFRQHTMEGFKALLTWRYVNQAFYRLPPSVPPPTGSSSPFSHSH